MITATGPAGAARAVDLAGEQLLEGAPVEQAGELIDAAGLRQAQGEAGDLASLVNDSREQSQARGEEDERKAHFHLLSAADGCLL